MTMSEDIYKISDVVADELTKAYQRALEQEQKEDKVVLDINAAKFVIFSDHHKGNRDGADDFRVCERAYNAALAYYYRKGYTLILLGDVEELWEERPQTVLKAYSHTQTLESKFHQDRRYLRFWGNHDDSWRYPDLVEKYLVPALEGGFLKVYEGLILHVMDEDIELGRLFLTHGHQGTLASHRIASISKFFVRYFWRPIQRVIKFSFNSPAKDFQLRREHDSALYFWSEAQDKIVLITGHTHRPVFMSKTHEATLRKVLNEVEEKLDKEPDNQKLINRVAELAAELEWVLAQNRQSPGEPPVIELKKPSYFNTGCCAFLDGDITGLEIGDGEIRLIRWPDDEGEPKPKVLVRAKLRDVFQEC
jgi:UDP-2,3-diacylglucosamine pyrophosphatase LpxH